MAMTGERAREHESAEAPAVPPSWRLTLLVGAVVALLTLPSIGVMPRAGLDFSWAAALHLAARSRLHFGSEVVFTYGPLGFLSVTIPYVTSTWVLSLAYVCALQLWLCATLVSVLRRSLGLPLAALAAFVLATVTRILGPTELALAVFVLTCILVVDRPPGRLVVALGGFVAGLHLLVKFNTGVAMLLVGAITAWVIGRRGRRSEAVFWSAATTSLLAGWLLTGNRLGDLALYVCRSAQVASGFSEAMGTDHASKAWEYPLVAAVVLVLGGMAWVATRPLPSRSRVATALVVDVWLFVALKHGFVRHDTHSVVFFGEAALVATAFCRTASRRVHAFAALCVLVLAVLAVNQPVPGELVDPRPDPLGGIVRGSRVLAPHRLSDEIERSRRRVRARYGLTHSTLAQLAGHTVHVAPMEATVAWAYPELDWKPLPVFQGYSAYTEGLDEANAAALSGPDAPERILAARDTIDGRYPGWESPAAMRAMACHYAELGRDGRWQVLARVPDRCGAEQPLASVKAAVGERVTVPRADPDHMVVARIHGLESSLAYRLRAQLLRIPPVTVVVDGSASYRLVPGTAGDGLLLSAPPAAVGWTLPFAYPDSVQTIEIRGGGWGVGDRLQIEFSTVALEPAAG